MSKAIKVINNSFFVFAARVFETISGIVVIGMLARYLGVSDFGEYSLVMAVVWIAQPIISMAVPRILVVELSRDVSKAASYIGTGITWNILAFAVLALALWLAGALLGDMPFYYFTGLSIALFLTLTQTVGAVFIAYERMKYDTYTSLTAIFFLILLTGGVIFLDLGLEKVFLAAALAYLCGFAASVLFNRKVAGFIPVPAMDYKILRCLLSGSLSLSLIQVLVQLLFYCGVFFLKYMSGNIEVALFQAPIRIFIRFMIIPLSLMVALLPLFSRLAAAPEKKSELVGTTKTVLKFLMTGSMLLTIIAFTTAAEVISLIFGNAFTDSVAGFKITVLSTIFFFINQFCVMLCIACDRIKGFAIIKMVELAICILLNLALVPDYGYIGSMWALVLSSCIMSFGGYIIFWDLFQKESLKSMFLIIVSGFGIIAVLNCAPSMNFIISLTAGVFCFASVMIMSKMVSWNDLRSVMSVIWRKTPQGKGKE